MENRAFYLFYENIYGDRWPSIYNALKNKDLKVNRRNLFTVSEKKYDQDQPERDTNGLLDYYIMDPASIVPALALEANAGDKVLDMCAAPGGKTLVLVEKILEEGEVTANDISSTRRERLTKVIQNYVPMAVRKRVWVTGKDAVQYGLRHKNQFDKILLDAPCSGERHLLENSVEFLNWTKNRSSQLAFRQYSLLSAAFLACKSGGRIIYSTCSLSPLENDEVIEKLLKKQQNKIINKELNTQLIMNITEYLKISCHLHDINLEQLFEKTKYGYIFLPDKSGWGPIYFSILEKGLET